MPTHQARSKVGAGDTALGGALDLVSACFQAVACNVPSASSMFIDVLRPGARQAGLREERFVIAPATVSWTEDGEAQTLRWQSEAGVPPPKRLIVADDRMTADEAWRLACEGTALLWRGDFQNARQLLQAMAQAHRAQAAQTAGGDSGSRRGFSSCIGRPSCSEHARWACCCCPSMTTTGFRCGGHPMWHRPAAEAYGPAAGPFVASLRELLGVIGAHEWRKTGVDVPALGARIHPHYGVFAPVRGEYVGLVATAPLPAGCTLAFDIGTGTGVLAAVLAQRGVERIVATDQDPRALACAAENLARLGMAARVELLMADLFPSGRASLIVCNPPWLPGRAASSLERAVYDPDSRMLLGFIKGLGRASGTGRRGLAGALRSCRASGSAHARRPAGGNRRGWPEGVGTQRMPGRLIRGRQTRAIRCMRRVPRKPLRSGVSPCAERAGNPARGNRPRLRYAREP